MYVCPTTCNSAFLEYLGNFPSDLIFFAVSGHNFRFEFDTNINILMGINRDIILINRKTKWKILFRKTL